MARYITLPVIHFKGIDSDIFSSETYAVIGGKYYWLGYEKILVNVFSSVALLMKNLSKSHVYGPDYIKRFHNLKKIPKPHHRKLRVYDTNA